MRKPMRWMAILMALAFLTTFVAPEVVRPSQASAQSVKGKKGKAKKTRAPSSRATKGDRKSVV